MNLELLSAKVGHTRFTPKNHTFLYNVFYVVCPVLEIPGPTPFFFSYNRFNFFSIYAKDHGARDGSDWRAWISTQCKERGISLVADDTVLLISHPRLFGYAFNPISFWLVYEKSSHLKAVVCEVRNTFGDNHNYFLAHPDGCAITPTDVFSAEKNLYVSPFNHMGGSYTFTFDSPPGRFKAVINYYENATHILNTYMGGVRAPLTAGTILLSVIRYPLMTLLVVARIHWQAVRLRLKGVVPTLSEKPEPTHGKTTIGASSQSPASKK